MNLKLIKSFFVISNIKAGYYYLKGLRSLTRGYSENAIKLFLKSLDNIQGVIAIDYNCNKYLGIAFCFQGNYEKAKKYLEIAIGLKQNELSDYELCAFLGLSYKITCRFEDAIGFLKQALRLEKPRFYSFVKDSSVQLSLGYCYYQLGKMHEAKEHYKKFLSLSKEKDEEKDRQEVLEFLSRGK